MKAAARRDRRRVALSCAAGPREGSRGGVAARGRDTRRVGCIIVLLGAAVVVPDCQSGPARTGDG